MSPFSLASLRMSLSTALVVSVCVVDSVTIAYDGSLMGSLNVMASYQKYFELTTATTAVNTCATFLGAILIGPFTGMLIDWKGRKVGLYASGIVNIIGAIIAGAAVNIAMFIAGRLIIGIGVGLGQTAAGTYVAETTAPSIRSLALGLYFSCWAVGALLAAGISYGSSALEPSDWAWRVPSILQAAPPLFVMILIYLAPESPRWLAFQDRRDEALEVLAKVNGGNNDDENVQMQFREIIETLEYEKREGQALGLKGMVRKPNRKRLLLALSVAPLAMLTGSNVITYYFGRMLSQAGITDSTTQLQINVILSSWQLVVAVTGSTLAEKLGRRLLALGSLGACSAFFYLLAGLTAKFGTSGDKAGTYGTIACIFLFLGTYSFGITPLTAMYAPEVLSYNMRANGIAMQGILIKSCGVLVSMAFPYLFESIGWKTYIVNASWNILIWLYVYFEWVETKGLTLEEIDVLFDSQKAVQTIEEGVLKPVAEQQANNSECEYPITEENKRSISVDQTHEILDRLQRLEDHFTTFSNISLGNHVQPDDDFTPHSYGPPSHEPSPESAFASPGYAPLSVDPAIHVSPTSAAAAAAAAATTPAVALASRQRSSAGTDTCITAPMAIPMSHSTTTGSLLQSRSAKALLGDYPADVFLRVESKRVIPEPLSLTPIPLDRITFPEIDVETALPLVNNFFDLVNPQHPILDREDFEQVYQDVVENQPFQPDLRTALVLVVMALGKAAVDTPDLTQDAWLPGVELFTPAMKVLLATWFDAFGDDLLLPQGLYLAALYYSYLSRPLQAWRLTHLASTSIQHFPIRHRAMRQPLEETHKHQPITRLCWAIFVLECDIVAEHHLPRSGIDQVIENLPFPRCGNPPDPAMLYWLADLSARRLLNRIHHVMYDTASLATPNPTGDLAEGASPTEPSASLVSVSAELSHQLGAWYDLLPSIIKPDLNNPSPSVDEAIMMLRYHAAGDIIFRPFLHQVCRMAPGVTPAESVVENAKRCLYHCRQFLAVAEHRLKGSCGSLEIVLYS
ncbi:hypothetical protein CkaCkLH20_10596 [Colletotrichum karsti]|uniref:Major facilitator superfamily (MFS) profile domain-containing protein n=1 Tax=Colletotrichum karsti TaxID=1095194 RepID=A0A9P6LDL4_9PEZI|nr:uncharacterized protein CkaCkLH20_10596 [Colletotrichum karsti]KAF9871964.1 hypothetical protein CkaCkLH20_10596 [Colletotrichum karsti]